MAVDLLQSAEQQMLSPGQVVEIEEQPLVPQEEPWVQNYNIHMMCPDCQETPPNIIEEFSSGDTVCGSCGLVLGDRIVDTRSEWRTFANDDSKGDDPSRVGQSSNSLIPGPQLETEISYKRGDSHKTRDLTRNHAKMTQDKSHKNLKETFSKISALCAPLHLSDSVVTTVQQLYKVTEEAKAAKGKSTDSIIAGCLLIACRQMGVPRTFKEIQHATQVTKRDIGRAFKELDKFFAQQKRKSKIAGLGGAGANISDSFQDKSSTSPAEICGRYCSALVLDKASTKVAKALAEKMVAIGALAGRSPLSAAAACIYLASHLMGDPKTPKEIANVASVNDGTIRTSFKLLMTCKDQLIDPDWLGEGKGDLSRLPAS